LAIPEDIKKSLTSIAVIDFTTNNIFAVKSNDNALLGNVT